MRPGIRAEWHLAELAAATDPFGEVVYSNGIELDLTAPLEELAAQFAKLLRVEGRLARSGLTCALKDSGQDCLSCPQATLEASDRRSRLCRLGKDQLTVERRCAELQDERTGPVMEMVELADTGSLLGHLDDELSELLTTVGL